jgi:dTDP-glucose 4,6-dehydratase
MATETNTSLANPSPSVYFETSVDGTRRVLDFAASSGARQLLLTSSGAVYGPQPPDCERLSENQTIAPSPENVDTAYGQGKRAAEFLCCAAHAETGLEAKIARCFAFVGPYLPLDSGFAIGNFIRDALDGDVIAVTGDGTPRRSYLYAADLALWLWTILLRGRPASPYNVGSERDVSIAELAHIVAQAVSGSGVEIAQEPKPGAVAARYVPDTSRAAGELGLHTTVSLEEAIRRTVAWHRTNPPSQTEIPR